MSYSLEQKEKIKTIFEDDFVIKKEPMHSLSECLNGYTKDKLITLRDIHHVEGITTRDLKQDLVDALLSEIKEGFAVECLYLSKEQSAVLFKNEWEALSLDDVLEMDYLIPLLTYGWVYMFRNEELYTLVFPDELAKILEEQFKTADSEIKKNQTALDVMKALVNLYGSVKPDFFQDVLRVYYPEQSMTTKELEVLLTHTNRLSFSIESDGQWIYHKQYLSQNAAHQIGALAKEHKRYWPSGEDIDYYSSHFYDTRNESYPNFVALLETIVPKKLMTEAKEKFIAHTKLATPTKEYMTFFKENNLSLGSEDDKFKFSQLYMKAYADSKTWPQAGHSENELTPAKRPLVGEQLQRSNTRLTPKAVSSKALGQPNTKQKKKKIVRKK